MVNLGHTKIICRMLTLVRDWSSRKPRVTTYAQEAGAECKGYLSLTLPLW